MPSLPARTLLVLLAAALIPCGQVTSRADDDDGRQDNVIGNPDRQRAGVNERGDNEMVIESKPRQKQQMPDMGPIYVVPQVNAGRSRAPVILPVPQQGQGQQGQGTPRQQGQPPARPGTEP